MATESPRIPPATIPTKTRFGKIRVTLLVVLILIFVGTVVCWFITRDAAVQLANLRRQHNLGNGQKTIVDVTPWLTAKTLAPQAKSTEEASFAREALRLSDHEVDQAFASAFRQQNVQHRPDSAEARALTQRVDELQAVVNDDQASIKKLAPDGKPAPDDADDLEILKAQLSLDNDILNDAQQQLAQATGDQRAQIQQELNAHEATMVKYDSDSQHATESANTTVRSHSTLSDRIQSWFAQSTRNKLLQQAEQQAKSDAGALSTQLKSWQSAPPATAEPVSSNDRAAKLEALHRRADQLQLLNLFNDRIQTDKQLATIYSQWSAQVELQHRLLLHLILQSLTLVVLILIAVVLGIRFIRHMLERPALDDRRSHTLRTILELSVQFVGAISILLVTFGIPKQTPTILGLTTAGLTVALQDFILAFLGWFVLMGRNGIRLGDYVEINGVAGQVAEVGLFRTTVLETGNSADEGHPTGRRVTFLNKYAINGQYFNFSTVGQWMWDEITVNVPDGDGSYAKIEQIHKVVMKETDQDAKLAEQEWERASKIHGLSQFTASAQVNLRPAASGLNMLIRYVVRAGNRFEMRNRLYQRAIEVLQGPLKPSSETAKQ